MTSQPSRALPQPKPTKKPEAIKVVAILWNDAVSTNEPPCIIPTMDFGVIVSENEDEIVLAHEIFADGDIRDRTTIGKKMIIRQYKLRTLTAPREFERYALKVALLNVRPDLNWKKKH